jgi:hypothetical protein
MKNPMNEKFYEEYAWVVFLIIGVLVLIGAIPHTFGINTDPALVHAISGQTIDEIKISNPMLFNLYDFYFRGGGLSDLGFTFFLIVITLTAYRKGQKWAWYAFWFVPAYFLAWIALSFTTPESTSSLLLPLILLTGLSLAGLFLPYRKFFSKREKSNL